MEVTILWLLIDLIFIVWGYSIYDRTKNKIWFLPIGIWILFLSNDIYKFVTLLGAM